MEALRHRYSSAEHLLREAVETSTHAFGVSHAEAAQAKEDLARVLWAENRLAEAEEYYQQALQSMESAWGTEDPRLMEKLERYARLLHQNKHFAKAEEAEVRAVRIKVRQALKAEHTDISG
jgi:tetratricopeptide (TPR) repeat protein